MAFREKTTLVVGAGASAEFGLPIGTGLAAEIKKSAITKSSPPTGDPTHGYLRQYIKLWFRATKDRDEAFDAATAIHEGIHTAVSIDAFIHRHRHSPLIGRLGKALIALEVLKAESRSTMSADTWREFDRDPNYRITRSGAGPDLVNPDYTWLGHFFRTMCDGIEDPNQIGNNVTIICFNYDRCIEHYIMQNLAAAYLISQKEALEILEKKITIIHPYGYLGALSPAVNQYHEGRLSYGHAVDDTFDVDQISKNIRTYTEQTNDAEQLEKIHRAISGCNNLAFLGFGFNEQNLNLLRVKQSYDRVETAKNVYCTGVGLYPQIVLTLKRRILDLFVDRKEHQYWQDKVAIEFGVGCEELFRIHQMDFASFNEGFFSPEPPADHQEDFFQSISRRNG